MHRPHHLRGIRGKRAPCHRGVKKAERVLQLILYGGHARADRVDDPAAGHDGDYHILIVVNDARLTDVIAYWSLAEDRLLRAVTITRTICAPVNIIVHDLGDSNHKLARGQPFFVDIVNPGDRTVRGRQLRL